MVHSESLKRRLENRPVWGPAGRKRQRRLDDSTAARSTEFSARFVALVRLELTGRLRLSRAASERWNSPQFSDPQTDPFEALAAAYAWVVLKRLRGQKGSGSQKAPSFCNAELTELEEVLRGEGSVSGSAAIEKWSSIGTGSPLKCDPVLLKVVERDKSLQQDLMRFMDQAPSKVCARSSGSLDRALILKHLCALFAYEALVRKRIEAGVEDLLQVAEDPGTCLADVLKGQPAFIEGGEGVQAESFSLRRALRAESASESGSLRRDLLNACRTAFPNEVCDGVWECFEPPNLTEGDLVWQELLLLQAPRIREQLLQGQVRGSLVTAILNGDHLRVAELLHEALGRACIRGDLVTEIERTIRVPVRPNPRVRGSLSHEDVLPLLTEIEPSIVFLNPRSRAVYRIAPPPEEGSLRGDGLTTPDPSFLLTAEVGIATLQFSGRQCRLRIKGARRKLKLTYGELADQLVTSVLVPVDATNAYNKKGRVISSALDPLVQQWLRENPEGRRLFPSEALHACVKGRIMPSTTEPLTASKEMVHNV